MNRPEPPLRLSRRKRAILVFGVLLFALWYWLPNLLVNHQLKKQGFRIQSGRLFFMGSKVTGSALALDLGHGNRLAMTNVEWNLTDERGAAASLLLSSEAGALSAENLTVSGMSPMQIDGPLVRFSGSDLAGFFKNLAASRPPPSDASMDLLLSLKVRGLPHTEGPVWVQVVNTGGVSLVHLMHGQDRLDVMGQDGNLILKASLQGHSLEAMGRQDHFAWVVKPGSGPLETSWGLGRSDQEPFRASLTGHLSGKVRGLANADLTAGGWTSRLFLDTSSGAPTLGSQWFAQGSWQQVLPETWWLMSRNWAPGSLQIPVQGTLVAAGKGNHYRLGLDRFILNRQPILDQLQASGTWPAVPEQLALALPDQPLRRIDLSGEQVEFTIPLQRGRSVQAAAAPRAEGGQDITLALPGGSVQAQLTASLLPLGAYSPMKLRAVLNDRGKVEEVWSSGSLEGHWQTDGGRWQGRAKALDLRSDDGKLRVLVNGQVLGKHLQGGGRNLSGTVLLKDAPPMDIHVAEAQLNPEALVFHDLTWAAEAGPLPAQMTAKSLHLTLRAGRTGFTLRDVEGSVSLKDLPPLNLDAASLSGSLQGDLLALNSDALGTTLDTWNRRGPLNFSWDFRRNRGQADLKMAWAPPEESDGQLWPDLSLSLQGGLDQGSLTLQAPSLPATELDTLAVLADVLPFQLAEGAILEPNLQATWKEGSGLSGTLTGGLDNLQVHFTRADWRNLRQIKARVRADFTPDHLDFILEDGSFEGGVPFTVSLQGNPDRDLPVQGTLGPVAIQDFVDGVFDYLPGTLAYGSWAGALKVDLQGNLSKGQGRRYLDFDNYLDGVSFTNEDGEAEIRNMAGLLPMRFHLDDPGDALPGDSSITADSMEDAWQELTASAAGGELHIERVTYTGLNLGPMVLRAQALDTGYTVLNLAPSTFLEGQMAAKLRLRLGVDNQSYSGLLLGRGLSLNHLCQTYEPIRGYVRGKLNLGLNFRNDKFNLPNLVGILRLWAEASDHEPMDVARQFLVQIGGSQFEAVFKGNRLRYDVGRLEVAIKEGQVTFHDLQLKHQADPLANLLRQDITYEVNIPKGDKNRVSLARLLELMKKYS